MNNNITTTVGDVKVTYNTETLSLYEYLGKAAGPDLGKAVAQAAYKAKVKITSHEVKNPKYTGTILKYPKSFLDEYFGKTPKGNQVTDAEDDYLPF